MAGGSFKPAVQARANHLNLQRKRFSRQPDTPLESNHLVIADEVGQQFLQGLAVQSPFDANVAADHLDMAVIVMLVLVVVVRVVSGLVVKSQDNRCLYLSMRYRKQSSTRADFVLDPPLNLSNR
tara:strand:- start:40 stop:411 length:372 start_codon:yes stop_codon:yes gene_type:complete